MGGPDNASVRQCARDFSNVGVAALASPLGGASRTDYRERRGHTSARGAESPSSLLASLILDGLDDRGLAALARRLLPHLRQPADAAERGHIAYTVASLAAELGVSQKAVRCAITRRELHAVKRGSRWIISAEAVRAWAAASDERRRTGRARGAAAPRAAGPSLRAVLSERRGMGGAR
jgi:excisionase family DNA binding protein